MTELVKGTDEKWHVSKGISVTTIITVVVAAVMFYTQTQVMQAQIDAVEKKLDILTDDRIHRDTVLQMFENRDLQMDVIVNDIEEVKEELQINNQLLRDLIQKKGGD